MGVFGKVLVCLGLGYVIFKVCQKLLNWADWNGGDCPWCKVPWVEKFKEGRYTYYECDTCDSHMRK